MCIRDRADILDENNIEYLKWDFNRSLTDIYYNGFPNERQGEVSHRYVLGVYSLLDRICSRYPNLLIEGCSSGGGRFDCGMLYYAPQIWASDNSDPIDVYKRQFQHDKIDRHQRFVTAGSGGDRIPDDHDCYFDTAVRRLYCHADIRDIDVIEGGKQIAKKDLVPFVLCFYPSSAFSL